MIPMRLLNVKPQRNTMQRSVIGGKVQAAFTLIELLVVISIVSLLISILLPALRAAREQAKTMTCMSQMRQAGLCFTMYQTSYKEFFPPYWFAAPTAQNASGRLYWMDLMKPYVNDHIPVPGSDNYLWFNNASPSPVGFRCPTMLDTQCNVTAFSSMGYNNYGLTTGLWSDNWLRLLTIRSPSKIMVVADAAERAPRRGSVTINDGSKLDFRHSGDSLNMLYADGHVKTNRQEIVATGWSNFYRHYPYMENWK